MIQPHKLIFVTLLLIHPLIAIDYSWISSLAYEREPQAKSSLRIKDCLQEEGLLLEYALLLQLLHPQTPQIDLYQENLYQIKQWKHSRLHKELSLAHQIDRLSLHGSCKSLDYSLGRQAIHIGYANSIQPMDFLKNYDPNRLEEIKGIDAIRARLSLSDLSELDAAFIAGKNLSQNQGFLKAQLHTDFASIVLAGMQKQSQNILGFALQKDLFDATGLIEASYQKHLGLQITSGLSYSWTSDLFIALEYHFRETLTKDAIEKHNLALISSYQLSALKQLKLQTLLTLQNPCQSNLHASYQQSLSENQDLQLSLTYAKKSPTHLSLSLLCYF